MLLLGIALSSWVFDSPMLDIAAECESSSHCERCDDESRIEPHPVTPSTWVDRQIVFADVLEPPPGPSGPGVFQPPRGG